MSENEYKNCPFCGNEIKVKAVKCKHCLAFLDEYSQKNYLINEQSSSEEAKGKTNRASRTAEYDDHTQEKRKGFFASLFDISMQKMITPKIIRIIYVVSLIGIAIGTLSAIIGAIFNDVVSFFIALIGAPLVALVAIIFLRVYMELIILLFNIYEQLKEIRKSLR